MAEYSNKIVDHFTTPRHVGELSPCDVEAFVGNPVCGDQIHLYARVNDGRIEECHFLAYGCAASLATASILCDEVRGLTLDRLLQIQESDVVAMVGGLTPTQKHCATIACDVLRNLVAKYRGEIPTESGDPHCR